MSRQSGFTLIEVIVAMVLISGAGMALFSWVNQSLDTIQRVDEVGLRASAKLAAVEYMQAINPMDRPDGAVNLGSYGVTWTTEPLTDARDGIGYPRGIGLFQVRLYKATVVVSRSGDNKWQTFDMQLVGYKRVRDPRLATS
jgi:general secretion pathway protein I